MENVLNAFTKTYMVINEYIPVRIIKGSLIINDKYELSYSNSNSNIANLRVKDLACDVEIEENISYEKIANMSFNDFNAIFQRLEESKTSLTLLENQYSKFEKLVCRITGCDIDNGTLTRFANDNGILYHIPNNSSVSIAIGDSTTEITYVGFTDSRLKKMNVLYQHPQPWGEFEKLLSMLYSK